MTSFMLREIVFHAKENDRKFNICFIRLCLARWFVIQALQIWCDYADISSFLKYFHWYEKLY